MVNVYGNSIQSKSISRHQCASQRLAPTKRGGWQSFHGAHIGHLQEAIEALLPATYYADSEQSLQRETIADEEDFLKGLAIYRMEGDAPTEIPVTRIELISPSNKAPHAYYRQYLSNRLDTLKAGVALIEIDYIHQRRPLLPNFPSYAQGDPHSFPYMVLSSNPRSPEGSGSFQCYGIGVLDPLPRMTIPLLDNEPIVLDLGAVYRRTYESRRRYALRVDYGVDPVDVERYTSNDRAKIQTFLAQVRRDLLTRSGE
jgi:hypothetical protein